MAPHRRHKKKPTSKHPYRSASQAANAHVEFPLHPDVDRKPTFLERILVGLVNYIEEVSPPPGGQILEDDLIDHIRTQAEDYGETFSNRATCWINSAISRLKENEYIMYEHNGIVRIKILPNLKTIMSRLVTEASAAGIENLANLSLREHRILAAYFRSCLKVPSALTRRQLALKNAELEYRLEQHKMICPLEQAQPQPLDEVPEPRGMRLLSGENRGLDGAQFTDSMYMDDVPAAGPSNLTLLQTPPRKSQSLTLNNPEAYPSPQSPPRRTGSRNISGARSPTPRGSFRMPGTLDEEAGGDDDMDIDLPSPPSPVPTELFSTAGDDNGNATRSSDYNSSYGDSKAIMVVQRKLNASLNEVEALRSEIQDLNREIEILKEKLEVERKQGLLMKVANIFQRSAVQKRLQEATRKKEEYQEMLRAVRGIVNVLP